MNDRTRSRRVLPSPARPWPRPAGLLSAAALLVGLGLLGGSLVADAQEGELPPAPLPVGLQPVAEPPPAPLPPQLQAVSSPGPPHLSLPGIPDRPSPAPAALAAPAPPRASPPRKEGISLPFPEDAPAPAPPGKQEGPAAPPKLHEKRTPAPLPGSLGGEFPAPAPALRRGPPEAAVVQREPESRPARPAAFKLLAQPDRVHSSQSAPPRPPAPEQKPAGGRDSSPAPVLGAGAPSPPPIVGARTAALTLEKRGPRAVRAGQPFAYEIVVRNVDTVAALHVRVEDELTPGSRVVAAQPAPLVQGDRLAWTIDALLPGGEQRFRVEVMAGSGGEWGGKATATVSVSQDLRARVSGGQSVGPSEGPPTAGQVTVHVVGPANAVLGHPAVFDLRVVNRGSVPLQGLLLRVSLPPGLDHPFGKEIEASLDVLAAGETRSLKLEVIGTQPGPQVAEAAVLSATSVLATAQTALTVGEDPVLIVQLVPLSEPVVGREVEYRVAITNRAAVARSVTVACALPEGAAFVGGSPGVVHDAGARTVRWALGGMEPGQARAVTMKLVSHGGGPVTHQVVVRADGHEARLHTILRFHPPGGGAPVPRPGG